LMSQESGCALKIDLSLSHHPQHSERWVPAAWPRSCPLGTRDKGHWLPVLAASAGFTSVGSSELGARTGPFLRLWVTVATGTSSSIPHRTRCCLLPTGLPQCRGAVPCPWPRMPGAEPSATDQ